MFQNNFNLYPQAQIPGSGYSESLHARQYNTALNQFRSALLKGKIARLKRRVTRRPQWLYDLNEMKSRLSVGGCSYAGMQVVRIDSILGSEGRTADFDMEFHPVRETDRERWVNMAIVYLARLPLPPIQLIRIGEAYFVRDGHHRISVARVFGQAAMDAEVVIWKASPPFPWEAAFASAPCREMPSFDLSI